MMGRTSSRVTLTNLVVDHIADGFETVSVTAAATVKSADVELKQTITMPEWVENGQASAEDQAAWSNEMSSLKAHEEGHVNINREQADKLNKALPGTSATASAESSAKAYKGADARLTEKVSRKMKANNTEARKRQRQYDTRTDHGRKPNVNIEP